MNTALYLPDVRESRRVLPMCLAGCAWVLLAVVGACSNPQGSDDLALSQADLAAPPPRLADQAPRRLPRQSASVQQRSSRRETNSRQFDHVPAPAPSYTQPAEESSPAVVAPSGASLVVAIARRVCASTDPVGTRVVGTVTQQIGAPDNSALNGNNVDFVVTRADVANNASMQPHLEVFAQDIALGGQVVPLTASVESVPLEKARESGSTGGDIKRAAAGAIVGGILGHALGRNRQGTATGAAIGAAVVGGGSYYTATRDACMPAGAAVMLRVDQPLTASR